MLALGWALSATINQGAEGVSEMGLWNVWMGGCVPLTLRRTGSWLPGSEDTDELAGNTGSFMPEQQLAVKRLLPNPDGG